MCVERHIAQIQRGKDVGVGGRLESSSSSRQRPPCATPASSTTTTTCGSTRFPQLGGRTCLQHHPPRYGNHSRVNTPVSPSRNQLIIPSRSRIPLKSRRPSCSSPTPPSSGNSSSVFIDDLATHRQSVVPDPPIPPHPQQRVLHPPRRPLRRYRATGASFLKVPQLPRLRENVRRLTPDLRQYLQESLQRLRRKKEVSTEIQENETDLSKTRGQESETKEPEVEKATPVPKEVRETAPRGPALKVRTSSVTSDYYSDSGEVSLNLPSLILDHEFTLHFDHVDEESRSSWTGSRATSRSTQYCDSSRTPSPSLLELPLEGDSDEARFLSSKGTENGGFRAPDKENFNQVEKLGGELKQNSTANSSAKKDFLKLVPETRLRSVKSFRDSKLAFKYTSSSSSPFKSTSQQSLCTSSLSSLSSSSIKSPDSEHLSSEPQFSAKASRGSNPAASWHSSNKPLQTMQTTTSVDDTRTTKMDNDKGINNAIMASAGVSGLAPLSFSLSSLSGWSSPALESISPARTPADLHTNSLNRRKSKRANEREAARRSWGPADKEEGSRDFWASIQEPYDYIMGSNLIPDSCQVGDTTEAPSSGEFELSWDSGDVSPPYVWSFSEFLDQYNELYEWLIQVQLKLYSHSNPPDKAARMAQQDELRRRTYRRKLFVEQGERVAQRYPVSAEEISWRVNYLNNKWDQLESTFTPAKGRNQEVEVELDLAHEEGILRRWLSDMEEQIQPLTCRLPRGCSILILQDRYKDNQILLKDIEAHGPVLKSVLRQYERLATAAPPEASSTREPTEQQEPQNLDTTDSPRDPTSTQNPPVAQEDPANSQNPSSSTSSSPSHKPSNGPRRVNKDSSNVPRKARSLEKRWHQIYLRSLEWHYYLEGVIANFKEQGSSASSESEDEPVSKCRRLSEDCSSCCGSWCGSPASSNRSSPTPEARPRRHHRHRWPLYDSNLSEAGSYIEPSPPPSPNHQAPSCHHDHHSKDDYVCLSGGNECGVALPPTSSPIPEPMVVEPQQQQQMSTASTTSPQNPEAPENSSSNSLPVEQQDQAMVGSAGLDTVRARCGQPLPSDILTDVTMIHDSSKSASTTVTNTEPKTTDHMENANQVNGNTMMSSTTAESGVQLTTRTEVSVNTDISRVRESPSKSSCTNVERPSPNCAIFDFKHQDTDTEDAGTNTTTATTATASCQANLNLVDCNPAKNRVYQVRRRGVSTVRRTTASTRLEFSCDEEVDHEALQKIIDSAILDPDWLNSNMPSDLSCTEDEGPGQEHMDTGSDGGTPAQQSQTQEQQHRKQGNEQDQEQTEPQRSMSKESIIRLVSDAERMVREPQEADEPPPVVSPRPHLQLPLNVDCGRTVVSSKQARVRQWLASQRREVRLSATCVLDSCDASGELTTGESDIESASSEDMDASMATHNATSTKGSMRGSQKGSSRGSRDPLPSADNTPTTERISIVPTVTETTQSSKVVLRSRKRRSGEQRPWSVSELYQLATRLDLAPFSVSETALHRLLTTTPETPTNDNQAFGPGPTTPDAAAVTTTTTAAASTEPTTPTVTTATVKLNSSTTTPTTTSSPSVANLSISSCTTTTTCTSTPTSAAPGTPSTPTPNPGRRSPVASNTGSLRRRKTRARRKSNLSLGRRTDSGSDGLALNLSGGSDNNNQLSPSRRLSLSKSLSSGSDTTSQSRRHIVKSSSFSGACRGGSGGMTSSTEKCVSDCGGVLGVPRTPALNFGDACYSSDESRPPSPVPVIKEMVPTPRTPPHTARSNTHLSDQDAHNAHEDMSSLSEQAWDPYQEYKYLSEPYSEDIDQEAARRLLDFGDDYRKYIDSDGASSFSGIPYRGRRSPHHRRFRALVPSGPRDLDSDSDLDDLHHVIDESRSQLTVTENVLKKCSNEAALGFDYAELVATTQTNIKCLSEIVRHLQMEGTLEPELREVQGIVQRWEVLQAQAVERQRQSGQVRDLQRQVKALRLALEKLTDRANDLGQGEEIEIHKDLTHKLSQAKELLDEVNERKVEVSGVNLAVHRFLTETGYSLTPLKDDVADLYRLWDEAHRRVSSEVSRLESVEATWKLWEAQAEELTRALRQDGDTLKVLDAAIQTGSLNDSVTASVQDVARLLNERRRTSPGKKLMLQHTRTQGVDIQGSSTSSTLSLGGSGDECLSDSGTSGYESCSSEELSERERRLAHLRRLARDLEASLHPNSQAWAAITKTLSSAESELKGLQKHCRELVVRSAETLDQAKSSPQLRRRSWVKDSKAGRSSRGDRRVGVSARDSCGRSNGRRGWMWRVVRAALPFQAALLLLFCVACLLEPNCCDHVNTLNLSLSPQLRYVHGPPPV